MMNLLVRVIHAVIVYSIPGDIYLKDRKIEKICCIHCNIEQAWIGIMQV